MTNNRISGLLAVAILVPAIVVVTTVAHAQTFSVTYNFGSKTGDPLEPTQSVVAQGRDGNLYSATGLGGIYGFHDGAVFKITPGGTLTLLYSFNLANSGPYGPFSGLTLGTDGNFYGTTAGGGASGAGTVFKITPSGTVTILHTFNVSDGEEPYAPPIQGTDGNFYGTAGRVERSALAPYTRSLLRARSRCFIRSTIFMAVSPMPRWCRAPMGIFTEQRRSGDPLRAMAWCTRSRPLANSKCSTILTKLMAKSL